MEIFLSMCLCIHYKFREWLRIMQSHEHGCVTSHLLYVLDRTLLLRTSQRIFGYQNITDLQKMLI